MKDICVITGGGSGMGFEAAKIMGKTHYIIISGRTVQKLENAVSTLKNDGIECESIACDVGNRESVCKMAERAKEVAEQTGGKVQSVIHAAGMSPHMGTFEQIIRTNALGTININIEFGKVMEEGGCILDVSSMSAYMLPSVVIPKKAYELSLKEETIELCYQKLCKRTKMLPQKVREGFGYGLSKNFVIWYAKKSAFILGKKGIRVLSVTPGNFATPMGKLEVEESSKFTKYSALGRDGNPEEIAFLFATLCDKRNGFITAVDILCDGGVVSSGEKVTKL